MSILLCFATLLYNYNLLLYNLQQRTVLMTGLNSEGEKCVVELLLNPAVQVLVIP